MIRYGLTWTALVAGFMVTAVYAYGAPDRTVPVKAQQLIEQGQFVQAREELVRFQSEYPDNPFVYLFLARIEEDYNKAIWYYKEAEILADSTLASEALFMRAELVFSTGAYAESGSLYERVVEEYPESSFLGDALYRLGVIRLKNGEAKTALEYFIGSLEAQRADTRRVYAAAGIMESYIILGEWNKALDAAYEVLREKDDISAMTPRVLEVIALCWRNLGNSENAETFTKRLLNSYPYSYQAHEVREAGDRIMSESDFIFDSDTVSYDAGTTDDTADVDSEGVPPEATFYVQTGAFRERQNALRLMKKIKDAGFDARVEMKTVKDEHLFIVRVGFYTTREEAEAMIDRIRRKTGVTGNVMIINR